MLKNGAGLQNGSLVVMLVYVVKLALDKLNWDLKWQNFIGHIIFRS